MEVGILRISDAVMYGESKERAVEFIGANLFKKNISISSIVFSGESKDNLKSSFDFLVNQSRALIVICDTSCLDSFKDFVCEQNRCEKVLNNFAKTGVDAYFKILNQPITKEGISSYYLPSYARCILNSTSEFVGFVFNYIGREVFVLPAKFDEVKNMFLGSVLPMISKTFNKNYFTISLKTFALSEIELKNVLSIILNNKKISVSVFTDGLVCEIIIRYQGDIDRQIVDEVVSKIYERVGKYIFTDEDNNLEDIICDILKVQNKTISIFEDSTFGSLTKFLAKSNSFEDFMLEKAEIIATDKTKKYFSDVALDEEEFLKDLLKKNDFQNNVCVANLKCKNEKNSYLIGIGFNGEFDVYKIRLTGENADVILKLNQTTFYYLIKKLKQKHF